MNKEKEERKRQKVIDKLKKVEALFKEIDALGFKVVTIGDKQLKKIDKEAPDIIKTSLVLLCADLIKGSFALGGVHPDEEMRKKEPFPYVAGIITEELVGKDETLEIMQMIKKNKEKQKGSIYD